MLWRDWLKLVGGVIMSHIPLNIHIRSSWGSLMCCFSAVVGSKYLSLSLIKGTPMLHADNIASIHQFKSATVLSQFEHSIALFTINYIVIGIGVIPVYTSHLPKTLLKAFMVLLHAFICFKWIKLLMSRLHVHKFRVSHLIFRDINNLLISSLIVLGDIRRKGVLVELRGSKPH